MPKKTKIPPHVALNQYEDEKLAEIEKLRPDLKNTTASQKVHVALTEWIKDNFLKHSQKSDSDTRLR